MKKLVIATRNKGKAREFLELLGPTWEIQTLLDLPHLPEVIEDGATFAENAIKKAVEISRHTQNYVLADDSGLEVDFLRGEPGVYSARYAGTPSNDENNNSKLLQAMQGVPEEARGAHFRCVLALAREGQLLVTKEGLCFGRLTSTLQGVGGFGYDPLFIPDRHHQSFGELSHEVKNLISHRAKAMRQMTEYLVTL